MPRHKAHDEPEVDIDAPPDHATRHWNPPLTAVPNAPPERVAPKPPVHWTGPPAVIQMPKDTSADEEEPTDNDE